MNYSIPYHLYFLKAMIGTELIEVPILFLMIRKWFRIGRSDLPTWRLVAVGLFASFATLPYLWFVLPIFIKNYFWLIVIGESLVILTEAIFYRVCLNFNFPRALTLSILCNTTSAILGMLLL